MNAQPLTETAEDVRRERDLYRATLVRIADAESGVWGIYARDVLRQVASLREERRVD